MIAGSVDDQRTAVDVECRAGGNHCSADDVELTVDGQWTDKSLGRVGDVDRGGAGRGDGSCIGDRRSKKSGGGNQLLGAARGLPGGADFPAARALVVGDHDIVQARRQVQCATALDGALEEVVVNHLLAIDEDHAAVVTG